MSKYWFLQEDAGQVIKKGKSSYPDYITIRVPKDRAVELAIQILKSSQSPLDTFDLSFAGKLDETKE